MLPTGSTLHLSTTVSHYAYYETIGTEIKPTETLISN